MGIKENLVNKIKSALTPRVYARWYLFEDKGHYGFETQRPAIGGVAARCYGVKIFEEKYNYSFTEEELKKIFDNRIPLYTLRSKFKSPIHPILHFLEKYRYSLK